MLDYIRSNDAIVAPFYQSLHGGADIKQETLIGGFFSWLVKMYMYYIMVE